MIFNNKKTYRGIFVYPQILCFFPKNIQEVAYKINIPYVARFSFEYIHIYKYKLVFMLYA